MPDTTALLTSDDYQRVTADAYARRVKAPDYARWRAAVEATGGCTHPIQLTGHHTITNQAGAVLKDLRGRVAVPCGNRRESVCPACSDRYAADAFHLLRAGLCGGTKDVPTTVAVQPRLFVTLTAPSFGPVHNRRVRAGRPVPCRCGTLHHEADQRLGQPLDPGSYDYTGHVLWQAHAGALWSRFTKYLRRHIAQAAGIRVRDFGAHARLSFAKVAEYQRRGVIHFHAVVRLDGPTGPGDPAPAWATSDLLTSAVEATHRAVALTAPEVDGVARRLAFGDQLDVRPIRADDAGQLEDRDGAITDDRLASYVAKYATKGTGGSETPDRPIRTEAHIDLLPVPEHHRRIVRTAWRLGGPVPCPACHPGGEHQDDDCPCTAVGYCETCRGGGLVSRTARMHHENPGLDENKRDPLDALNLRRWAHMLAFRGHFLTKSKHYSVPFRRIRDDRRRFQLEHTLADLGVTEDAITVVNDWHLAAVGHPTSEDRELAAAIAERRRDARRHRYQTERKD
ncbi:replication initiator [Saccharopolyspora cebuensis]|uniref:Replication initiator n=1 Tax=Saccharopolyspora cebuensis TaxID=418759 RepID=A0ABV4CDI2_9PSEU